VYSIDESFIEWTGFRHFNLDDMAFKLRRQVHRWVGIPVGIGIGQTKTLAKVANRLAKKHPAFKAQGICNLTTLPSPVLEDLLKETPVGDVWGIGRRWSAKLEGMGIRSALDLSQVDPPWVRKHFNVVMERTALELRGVPCISMEQAPPPKQQIISSRSFGKLVTDLDSLRQAVSAYTARAAEKLRYQGSQTSAITVFLNTPPFNPAEPQYHPSVTIRLADPTDDTLILCRAAGLGLPRPAACAGSGAVLAAATRSGHLSQSESLSPGGGSSSVDGGTHPATGSHGARFDRMLSRRSTTARSASPMAATPSAAG
jgi:DNA polymerase V